MAPIIQVAGVIDAPEAECLLAAGVTHLGFPLRLPAGGEDQDEAAAADLVALVGRRATSVLITYEQDVDALVVLARALGVQAVQLHADIAITALRQLRARVPDLFLIRSLVIGAEPPGALAVKADASAPFVDAFLTDTFDPATGRRGATGRVHDWAASRALVARLARPLILAGGLHPGNVGAAIRAVRPAGVDAHTGLEGPEGRKDPERVRAFVVRARQALESQPDHASARTTP